MTESTRHSRDPGLSASPAGGQGVGPAVRDREYECKLGGDAGQMQAARKAAQALSIRRLRWVRDDLENVYFDTPDLRLGGMRVSLRVRRKGTRFTQTVKSDNAGGGALFARGEWEQAVDGMAPRLDLLPEPALDCLGLVLPGELRETIRTRFIRERATIVRQGPIGPEARIEIAFDTGEVTAGGQQGRSRAAARREAIRECELELKQGDPRDLFEVALALQQEAGLSVIRESKAARGYRLMAAAPAAPCKAEPTALSAGGTVNDAIAAILRAGLGHMLANEAPALEGRDPEGVHQFRVAVRRLRSVLTVFGRLLDPACVDWLKVELKWIADQFGPARDWDVFAGEILHPVLNAGIEPAAMAALAEAAEERRRLAYGPIRKAIASPRYGALVLKLSAFTETEGWSPQPCPADHPLAEPVTDWAPKLLARAYKKVIRAGDNLAELDVPARHEVRIRLKRLRYATDFLQSLYDGRAKARFLKAMARLQDDFGHLNDVAVAQTLLADLIARRLAAGDDAQHLHAAAAAVVAWHARGLHDNEPRLLKDWQAFAEARPFWRRQDG